MWAVVRAHRLNDWSPPEYGQHATIWAACYSREGDGGWAVTCGVVVDLPTGLCTRQPQCCPYGPIHTCLTAVLRYCRKGRCTANSSMQLMCQSSRGPVQSPEAACLLHVAPQPMLEASVVTITWQNTCSKGTRPVESKVHPWAEGAVTLLCDVHPKCTAVPCPSRDLGVQPVLKWSHMKQPERGDCSCECHMPQEPLNCFSRTTVLPLKELRQFSTDWAR